MSKRGRIAVMLGAMVLAGGTACGSDSSGAASSGSGGAGGAMTLSIVEPADAASVQLPFTLRLNSSVPLGTTESGQHHVHVYFDGNDSKYEVVESDTVEISTSSKSAEGLSPGQHELNASLRNADHSPAGVETKIMIQVGGAGGGQPSTGTGGTGGGDGY